MVINLHVQLRTSDLGPAMQLCWSSKVEESSSKFQGWNIEEETWFEWPKKYRVLSRQTASDLFDVDYRTHLAS